MLKTAYGVHTLALQRDHPTTTIYPHSQSPSVSATNMHNVSVYIHRLIQYKEATLASPLLLLLCYAISSLLFFPGKNHIVTIFV